MVGKKGLIPRKTENTFNNDPGINRSNQTKRSNDTIIGPVVTLEDVDKAIKYHMENVIKPYVLQAGNRIPVPVMYASPERWANVQKFGHLKDTNGRILLPLILFRRNTVTKRNDLRQNKVLKHLDNVYTFKKKLPHDPFTALSDQKHKQEHYVVAIPDFVEVSYDFVIWADFVEHLNGLVESIVYHDGSAWGDTYKFISTIDSYNFEENSAGGEDRFSRATLSVSTKAYLIPENIGSQVNLQKAFGIDKMSISFNEAESVDFKITTDKIKHQSKIDHIPVRVGTIIRTLVHEVDYLGINITKVATSILANDGSGNTVATFSGEFADAPTSLPATSKDNFFLFINGQNIPNSIWSIIEVGSNVKIFINITSLGYELASTDEVIAIGKFKP